MLLWSIYYRNWWNDWKVNSITSWCIWRKRNHLILIQENQPWISIGRTGAEAAAPILWPPDGMRQLIGKDLDAGKDWEQEEKGVTENETVGWHHWLNGHEFEQTQGDSEGQGRLACYSSWSQKNYMWLSNWTTIATTNRLMSTPIVDWTLTVQSKNWTMTILLSY